MATSGRFSRKQGFKISEKTDLPTRPSRDFPAKTSATDKPVRTHKALTHVLGQTEEVKGLVEEAAEDISSVNAGLKQAIELPSPPPHVKWALEISQTAESKVQEAADKLAVVNSALKDAVQERQALEVRLAEVTEREEASRHASFHDPLTGLANRTLANDRLAHGLAQARRHGWRLALMFIDLDDFKNINDTYGHDAGDHVLKIIAARLNDCTRDDDTLSRHGGDEFLYVMTEYDGEQHLTTIADKLVTIIQAPCEICLGDITILAEVSASIGIAVFPRHGETAGCLIKSADSAMYRAKRSQHRVSFAS